MEIDENARKHGISDLDIRHAIEFRMIIHLLDGYTMIVGPTTTGRLIEVGFRNDNGLIFHAMHARQQFLPQPRRRP